MKTNNGTSPKASHPFLGKAELTDGGLYLVKERADIDKIYTIQCPKCNKALLIKAPAAKAYKATCKVCSTPIYYKGREETVVNEEKKTSITEKYVGSYSKTNAKLVWGGILNRKSFCINSVREYSIGRTDDIERSDISINDEYASRRSAVIKVIPKAGSCMYQFTVKKASNPVLVNGKALESGESIYLNYGDTILMGETTLTFSQNKK